MTRRRKTVAAVLLSFVILLTLAFIFTRSLKSPVASTEESDRVRAFLSRFFDGNRPIGGFVLTHVRKIAHFAEYATLGAEVYFLVLCVKNSRYLPHFAALMPGIFTASLDEFLQLFSGRGASVFDVALDFSGYLTATLVLLAAETFIRFLKNKNKTKYKE